MPRASVGSRVAKASRRGARPLTSTVPVANPQQVDGRDARTSTQLLLTLKDAAGAVLEVIPSNVGFRKVEITRRAAAGQRPARS